MAVNLSPIGGVAAQFLDNSGNPLSGGKIFTYAAGTTTPQASYTTAGGGTPHSNPIILDAAGRVPSGEIWLTDGLQYKFLIKTSADVQIGSYDNIIGINSNFVNYTNSQEIQTATAGQTVFTLTTMVYQPGTNSLSVFVDGVNQYGPGALYAYQETSDTVVTFTAGLHVGAEVKFTTSSITSSSATDAEQVGYIPPFTGGVPTNVEAKLAQTVSAKDFGAVGDGVTDDTAALKAAFDYAIPAAISVELAGTYLVTGPIQPYASRASGSAHIVCKGNVIINVSGIATAFRDLFYLETTAANNCSITGGSLTIDCNNKAASGITFRHNAASQNGTVNISCPVEILNCYNNDAASTYENQGIAVIGDYETVVMEQPRVVGVSRIASGGACKGIAVSAFTGVVTINQPYVANVLTGGGTVDADGIAVFGKSLGTTYNARGGVVNINEPVFVDCQGRSFKSQCSDTTVFRPRVFRKDVVSITNGADFDFQTGGQSLVIEPYYEYRLNGGTSPLGSSFTCISFQQLTDDKQNVAKSIGGVLRTEVLIPRYSFTIYQSTALASYAEVSGLVIEPIGALTTRAIARAIIEFRGDTVGAKSAKTTLAVRNCRGPIGTYAIGYTAYDGSVLTSKLSFEVVDNYSTILTPAYNCFSALSGTVITAVEKFVLRDNYGFNALLGGSWTFNFNSLAAGSAFTVDIATVSATNAPAWGATGYAFIESFDQWFEGFHHIRVTVNNAATANTVFFTQGGATPTWGTIK
jgi:hypothetical protein